MTGETQDVRPDKRKEKKKLKKKKEIEEKLKKKIRHLGLQKYDCPCLFDFDIWVLEPTQYDTSRWVGILQ